jgi:hypothetical protein
LQSKQDESGCLELSCVPKSVCRLPYWKSFAGDCEDLTKQIYWYNSEAGRCEVKYTGDGCEPTQNAFESDQACWDACGPTDYGGRCFDTWRADWDAEEFTPSALLPAEPISLTHEQADALVASEYKAQLTYPDRSQSELTLSFSNATAYWVTRRDNPLRAETELPPNPGEIECPNGIVVEADARLTTADGRLDETWPGVQVVLGQRSASLGLSLWVPSTWQESQNYDVRVHGTYLPAITSEQCVLGTSLSLSLVDGAMSGSISHMLIDLPCAQVMPTTGISNPSGNGAMLPAMPPPPSGPVWSSLVVDPTAQFCVLESSNTKGPDEVASSVGLSAISDDDPATQPVVFRDVLGECTARGLKHCTPEGLITLWAAECLARASSFEAGLEAWETSLVLRDDYEDPVWIVHSVLQRDGASSSGEDLIIDAATGEILTTLGWQQEP